MKEVICFSFLFLFISIVLSNKFSTITVGNPDTNVWIVGSSIIKDAFVSAKSRPGGTCLGLSRLNVSIWWQGKRGRVTRQIKGKIRLMKKYEDPPQFIILHVAGNDLGCEKVGFLRNNLKNIIRWILIELPNTTIIWSQILPRLKWRYSDNQTAMHECRYRINNSIASFVTKLGGHYIRYPDIHRNYTFLKSDGVHLTPVGNDIFLNIMQGAIEYFMLSNLGGLTFPTHNESS